MSGAATRTAKRWLYIGHRWLGIATCLLCAMWFVSGVVMMYVPYPRLTDRERLTLTPVLDAASVKIAPEDAMRAAGLARFPAQLRLTTQAGEPVYRIVDGALRKTISARDGRVIESIDATAALAIVRAVRPDANDASVETFARDQWTVAQGFNPHRPLHKVLLGDADGTDLYVSSQTGEIVQDTTRRERFWNWLGSVPHWLYPTVLRQDGDAWRQVVLWTSGPATIGAIAGIWIGILRLRVSRRYKGERATPYRGWMKWHHVAGLVAGLFLTTWLWSGWLSVNPFRWFDRAQASPMALRDYAGQDAPVFPADVLTLTRVTCALSRHREERSDAAIQKTANMSGLLRSARNDGMRDAPSFETPAAQSQDEVCSSLSARELRFLWFAGKPLVVSLDTNLVQHVFDARSGEPVSLTQDEITTAAKKLLPGAPLIDATLLTEEDAYWYSHHVERRLPVLRVTFADADETWLHIDPQTGDVLGRTSRSGRLYRWLFNALHDFDLRVLLRNRPAWDIVVWLLSIGGLIVSVSGIVIGWRRLGRKLATAPR